MVVLGGWRDVRFEGRSRYDGLSVFCRLCYDPGCGLTWTTGPWSEVCGCGGGSG